MARTDSRMEKGLRYNGYTTQTSPRLQKGNEKRALTGCASSDDEEESNTWTRWRRNLLRCRQPQKEKEGVERARPLFLSCRGL